MTVLSPHDTATAPVVDGWVHWYVICVRQIGCQLGVDCDLVGWSIPCLARCLTVSVVDEAVVCGR